MTSEIEHIFSFWDKKGNCWSKNEIDGTDYQFLKLHKPLSNIGGWNIEKWGERGAGGGKN